MKSTLAAFVYCAVMGVSLEASAQFTSFLDGTSLPGDNGWAMDSGDPGVIVDLGGGNSGIQQTDDDTGGDAGVHGRVYHEYYLTIDDTNNTLAARFRVDSYSYSGTDTINLLQLTAGGDPVDVGNTPAIGVGIRDVGGEDHWALLRFTHDAFNPGMGTLLDLAPVVLGEFNDARIYIDRATDVVRFSWNGMEVYNAVTEADFDPPVGYSEFGASNYWGEGGTSTVTYDWVGYGPGYIPMPGDVNFDGAVNIFDINLVSSHWGETGPAGDANGDMMVNIFDINLISASWTPTGAVAVPEPATWSLALLAALALLPTVRRLCRAMS